MMRKTTLATAVVAAMSALVSQSSQAQDTFKPTTNDFGNVGLMQMPTARMAEHGEFTATYMDNEEYRRMAVNLQLLPWLEATIRYNDIRTRLYSSDPDFSGDQTYKDRGFDLKARLLKESFWLPEVSVGLRDIAGTGLFSGEFIAASKSWGDFDFTLGMGWGNIGQRDNISNPFCDASDSFCQRQSDFGNGGELGAEDWFAGKSAIFGGVEYQTQWEPLRIKVEFDGNDYSNEAARVPIKQDSPWNYGLHYQVGRNASLKLSYERGNTWMFGFSLRTNFGNAGQIKNDEPMPAPKRVTAAAAGESYEPTEIRTDEGNELLRRDLVSVSGFYTSEIRTTDNQSTLVLHGGFGRYRDSNEGLERLGRVVDNHVDNNIKKVRVVEEVLGSEVLATEIDLSELRKTSENTAFSARAENSFERSVPSSSELSYDETIYDPEFEMNWPTLSVKPFLTQGFGNPEDFYIYQVGAYIRSNFRLAEKTFLQARLGVNLSNNFDEFNFLVDNQNSSVPRVRTFVREYVTQSDIWLENLYGIHFERLSNDVYSSFYGGYLERMYGGVGSEVMYRPLDKNWAVGVDVNWVKQRSYESHFGFNDYDAVTGHVTGYWQPNFLPNSLIKVAAGQFLAEDRGVQVTFEHRFDSGIIAGAYAAQTNVSAEEYGEGSFTKGFYISIPLDLLQMKHSRSRGAIGWTPLTRDGGQMLMKPSSLYNATDGRKEFYN